MEHAYENIPLAAALKKKPSFSTLVRERFYNDIIAEIELYCRLEKVDIYPISIKKVIVTKHDIEEQNLYFDAILNCVLHEDGIEKHIEMVVDAYFDLNKEFNEIHTRCACPTWGGYHPVAALPDNLVPAISKRELETVASRIINTLYPRATNYADPINVNQVLRKLRLTVRDVHLDSDDEILGKIFFQDTSTVIADPMTGIPSILPVSAGTILVNTPISKVLDEAVRNNTILHECVHWILHRPAFLLAKLWNQECSAIACRRPGSAAYRQWTDMDCMEWQANTLAPKILMPDWATRFVARGWLRRYDRLSPVLRMERTIDRLSHHFHVSRQLAKIRMIELGFEDASYAFSYYDKRKHTISFENAARELARNTSFHDALSSGAYAYVDNCIVVRDRKYVFRDEDGALHLTPFAKANMAECCLAFAARFTPASASNGMLRNRADDESFITGSGLSSKELADRSRAVSSILRKLPMSFSDTLVDHMKRKGYSSEKLAEVCQTSSATISRYRRDKYPNINLPSVISLCIGLKLHPVLANDLLHKAGLSFNGSFEHTAYQMLLLCMTNCSLAECNDFLTKLGIPPLGNEEK